MTESSFDTLALVNRFQVKMENDIDLGFWSSVSGLDVTWGLAEYRAGDLGNSRMYFPGATKFTDIVLTRAACADTEKVRAWLSKQSIKASTKKSSGTIMLGSSENVAVMSWELKNVMPLKWAIEKFDASASKVAIETLTLAHEGFLDDETKFG